MGGEREVCACERERNGLSLFSSRSFLCFFFSCLFWRVKKEFSLGSSRFFSLVFSSKRHAEKTDRSDTALRTEPLVSPVFLQALVAGAQKGMTASGPV